MTADYRYGAWFLFCKIVLYDLFMNFKNSYG